MSAATATPPDTTPLLRRAKAIAKTIAELEGKLEGQYAKRTEVFVALRDTGLTNQAIADAAGVSEPAVRKALRKAAGE